MKILVGMGIRPLVRSAQPNPTVVPIGESPMARLIKKLLPMALVGNYKISVSVK